MPQMYPMNWVMVYFLIFLIFLVFFHFMYFTYLNMNFMINLWVNKKLNYESGCFEMKW